MQEPIRVAVVHHNDRQQPPVVARMLPKTGRHSVVMQSSIDEIFPGDLEANVDVLLIWMPGNPIDIASSVEITLNTCPQGVRVVLMSDIRSPSLVGKLLADGLAGYVSVTASFAELVRLINQALAGEQAVCSRTVKLLKTAELESQVIMTPKQIHVLKAICATESRKAAVCALGLDNRDGLDMAIRRICRRLGWRTAEVSDMAAGWLYARGYL